MLEYTALLVQPCWNSAIGARPPQSAKPLFQTVVCFLDHGVLDYCLFCSTEIPVVDCRSLGYLRGPWVFYIDQYLYIYMGRASLAILLLLINFIQCYASNHHSIACVFNKYI